MPSMTELGIMIKTLYDGKGTKAATKDLTGLEKQTGKSESALSKLRGGFPGIGLAAVGMGAALFTAKKAFDFTKEGAELNQLEDSFNLMNKEVFKTPGLLDNMKEAAKGTIKETDLMKGLLTLTAGATREVSTAMAAASPQLIKIAKAANKLNPLLGDTGFLYDSLALGIKRASPMILDNLGLTIKVGEANEKYAKSLGKTVKELTAQEKQLALLEAALRSGDKLIQQVGGNVDAQTDSWNQLTVAVGDFYDELKKAAGGAAGGPLAGLAGNIMEAASQQKQLNLINEGIKSLVISQEELNAVVALAATSDKDYADGLEELAKKSVKLNKEADSTVQIFRQMQTPFDLATKGLKGFTEAEIEAATEAGNLADVFDDLDLGSRANMFRIAGDAIAEMVDENETMIDSFGRTILVSEAVTWKVSALGDAFIVSRDQAADLNAEVLAMKNRMLGINEVAPETKKALGEAYLEIWREGKKAADELERVALAWDEVAKREDIDKKIHINTVYTQIGAPSPDAPAMMIEASGVGPCPPGMHRSAGKCVPDISYEGQHGANFIVPAGYPNDTFPMRVTSGEHVQVTPRGRGRGGNVYITQQFIIRGGGNPYTVAQEAANQAAITLGDKMRG